MLSEIGISWLSRIKNRNIAIPILVTIIMILAGCSAEKGSVVVFENPSGTACSMDYTAWSSNNKWTLYLSQGESLQIEIDHAIGDLDLSITGKNGSRVYAGNDLKSCIFTITVSESDDYVIQISGLGATGSLSIKKILESSHFSESSVGESMKDHPDVPAAVLMTANEQAAKYFNAHSTQFPQYDYIDWRIESLEWVYSYAQKGPMTLDIYRMNYEYLTEAPEKIVLAGGMYMTEDNWLCPIYPNSTYLVFNADSDVLLFVMMENDCYPGDEIFTEDLLRNLSSLQIAPSEYAILVDGKCLSLGTYWGDFPWNYSLKEIHRDTIDGDVFHNINNVLCEDLEVTYMQSDEDNQCILTSISTTSPNISTFRGIACGMSEADLLKAYGVDLKFEESYADNGKPAAAYDYVYGYAPSKDETYNHIVFLIKSGFVTGIEIQNMIDGRLFQ